MASIVLTQINEFTGERMKKVVESDRYDFILYPQSTHVAVVPKGGRKALYYVAESIGEITKLINNADNPKLDQILKNQKQIMDTNKKILAILEMIFKPGNS